MAFPASFLQHSRWGSQWGKVARHSVESPSPSTLSIPQRFLAHTPLHVYLLATCTYGPPYSHAPDFLYLHVACTTTGTPRAVPPSLWHPQIPYLELPCFLLNNLCILDYDANQDWNTVMWCCEFTTASLNGGNPGPNCHHTPRTTCITIFFQTNPIFRCKLLLSIESAIQSKSKINNCHFK